jgi:hypothetical protein
VRSRFTLVISTAVLVALCAAVSSSAPANQRCLVVHHLRDWHYIPKELFARDTGLTGSELDTAWAEYLDGVEAAQAEQVPVLRELVSRGVQVVYLEGVTREQLGLWSEMAEFSRESRASREEIEELTGRTIKPPPALRELFLNLGATALVDGIVARPLEETVALERATPVGKAGSLGFHARGAILRERAWARALAGSSETEVIVITGAAHDLAEVLRRESVRAKVEVITVPTVARLAAR